MSGGLIDERHIRFLEAVKHGTSIGVGDRENDRIRQFCRCNGFAEVLKGPRRWSVTEKGDVLLDAWSDPHA